jgi:hypothetical protein
MHFMHWANRPVQDEFLYKAGLFTGLPLITQLGCDLGLARRFSDLSGFIY